MGSCVEIEEGKKFEEETDFYLLNCPSIMQDLIQNELQEKIQFLEPFE